MKKSEDYTNQLQKIRKKITKVLLNQKENYKKVKSNINTN